MPYHTWFRPRFPFEHYSNNTRDLFTKGKCVQVRNKWLRILETLGGRSGNMTGAVPFRASQAADGTSASAQSAYNSGANGSGRGRGRGRGGPRNRGNGRGSSRVVPRQPTPPAMVTNPILLRKHLL
jgi:hypothetical protein